MEAAVAAVPDRGFGRSGVLRVFIILISTCVASGASGFLGVNVRYPKLEVAGGRLPKAEHVVDLLQVLQVRHIKLQGDAHPSILRALSGSKIQVLLTVPDQSIPALAQSRNAASEWLDANVLRQFPSTEVTGIVVGSELMTRDPSLAGDLIEAARKIQSCIAAAGLDEKIKVSASLSMQLFLQWGHKPSSAAFDDLYQSHVHELLDFLAAKRSYVMIDVDPFEAHLHDGFSLDFAMTSSSSTQERLDEVTKVGYSSLLDAAVDSAYNAMEKLGFSNIPVVVGAIGWPWKSSGSESDAFSPATVENAAHFTRSLVKRIQSDKGTPHKPEASIRVYVHELFDIVGPADATERRRYGLFSTSEVPRYSFHLSPEVPEAEILMRRVLADGTNGTNGTSGGTPTGGSGQFCVAAQGAPDSLLSVGLNWACGQGNADCTPIQQNGACYLPDTYAAHASYAFNSYYQKNVGSGATCDFQGAATLTSTDPSHDSCIYTSSGSSGGGVGGGGGGSTSGGTTGPSSSGGILQPFNPSSNTSSAEAVRATVGATFMLAVLVWTWRFGL